MRTGWKILIALGAVFVVAFLAMAVAGAYLLFSGQGTGHVEWSRIGEAPQNATELPLANVDQETMHAIAHAPVGQGGLFVVSNHNAFWSDVRSSGVPADDDERIGCWVVLVDSSPIELCEGPLI